MKLLLDAHIAPAVAKGLVGQSNAEAQAIRDWQGGTYLDADDKVILSEARATGWVLVTYDLRTIPPQLKEWSEQGVAHGGVILVDEHTIAPSDVGGLIRALLHVAQTLGDVSWEDRVVFLQRA